MFLELNKSIPIYQEIIGEKGLCLTVCDTESMMDFIIINDMLFYL